MFHHPPIDQKKSKSVKGMKNENKEQENVKGLIDMEI
jgi:hypothetical protein